MKNFLIPTTLKEDTIGAVKSAIYQAKQENCEIILLMISETPDTYSAVNFLRTMRKGFTEAQESVLESCRQIIGNTGNCEIRVHNQYGFSSAIFKQIINAFSVKLVILPRSYEQESGTVCQYFENLTRN